MDFRKFLNFHFFFRKLSKFTIFSNKKLQNLKFLKTYKIFIFSTFSIFSKAKFFRYFQFFRKLNIHFFNVLKNQNFFEKIVKILQKIPNSRKSQELSKNLKIFGQKPNIFLSTIIFPKHLFLTSQTYLFLMFSWFIENF